MCRAEMASGWRRLLATDVGRWRRAMMGDGRRFLAADGNSLLKSGASRQALLSALAGAKMAPANPFSLCHCWRQRYGARLNDMLDYFSNRHLLSL